jgi:large subunit ribosomal protein L25
MSQPVLAALARESSGKGAARKLRRADQIPAIFYGPGAQPIMLTVELSKLQGILNKAGGENVILDLEVTSDSGTETKRAMLKDLQIDPLEDTILHADFYEISMDKEITVDVSIQLVNTPVGVTNGGILQHVRRELTITCLPDNLVDSIELDVSDLDVGDSIHIRDMVLPEGITSEDEGHLTVAVVAAPTVSAEVEEEEEEGMEEEEEQEEQSSEEQV